VLPAVVVKAAGAGDLSALASLYLATQKAAGASGQALGTQFR
jgi:hypothetical protein